MIESGHGREVLLRNIFDVVLEDGAHGVAWVAYDEYLCSSLGVIVDVLSCFNENVGIILQEVSTFHAGSSGLSSYEESEVNVFEAH